MARGTDGMVNRLIEKRDMSPVVRVDACWVPFYLEAQLPPLLPKDDIIPAEACPHLGASSLISITLSLSLSFSL